jgi:hypothetical protein
MPTSFLPSFMTDFLSAESLDAVHELAEGSSALGKVTKEALDVIGSVLDEFG